MSRGWYRYRWRIAPRCMLVLLLGPERHRVVRDTLCPARGERIATRIRRLGW